IHVKLGRAGSKAVEQADKTRLLVTLRGEVVRLPLERVEVYLARGFHHELEAASVAEALDGRCPEDIYSGFRNLALEALTKLVRDGLRTERRVAAFVERPECHKHRAEV